MKDRIEKESLKIENSLIRLINKARAEGSCSGLFSQFLRYLPSVSMIQFCPVTGFIQRFFTWGLAA